MRVFFFEVGVSRFVVKTLGSKAFNGTCKCIIVTSERNKTRKFVYMRSELRAGDVGVCLKYRLEQLFESTPRVLFQPWSGGMACGADAVKTRFVSTLVNGFAFGDNSLGS